MKFRLKKRIITLNIGLLAVMIFSFVYIWIVGDTYTLHTSTFIGTFELNDPEVVISDESVVKLDKIYLDGEEITARFTAVGTGDTNVSISYRIGSDRFRIPVKEFNVNVFGTIIDRSGGDICFNGFKAIIYAVIAQLLMTEFIMLWMFVDYCRKGVFSYPMVACGGISIYNFFLIAYVVYYLLNNYMYSFTFFLSLVSGAGFVMLILLVPLMLLLSVLLAVSNIWLMRHEGFRPVNALGIIFAVLWVIGTLATVGAFIFPINWLTSDYDRFLLPAIYVIGYMECLFISTVVCSFLSVKYQPPYDRDYIIILGCALHSDGTLTPLLKGRVDSAVRFEQEQYEKTGKHAVFVPSGGQGIDEVISEGQAMENYLLSIGVPADRIAREEKSVNTYQNMAFSKAVIDAHSNGKAVNIAFATTNYHIFRGYILSKKLGFDAVGISAKTKQYFFPNAFLREFIGLLVDQKYKHLIFLLLTVSFFTFLYFV